MDGRPSRRSLLLGVLGGLATVTLGKQSDAHAAHKPRHQTRQSTTSTGVVTPNVETRV